MKRFNIIIFLFLLGLNLLAHPWKPAHYVIIDTDCGIDDYRAICMMLAAPDIRVLGIIASDGVLDSDIGYSKLKSLLKDLHHEGIPVGISGFHVEQKKDCPYARDFSWGTTQDFADLDFSANDIIEHVLINSKESIDYVCLGSLTTVAGVYAESKNFRQRINNVFWSSGMDMNDENLNYFLDKEAYRYIIEETNLSLHVITGESGIMYNREFTNEIFNINNVYSSKVYAGLHDTSSSFSKILFDERIPVYFGNESLFQTDSLLHIVQHKLITGEQSETEHEILELVQGFSANQNQVLKAFPIDSSYYKSDIRQIMDSTILKFGKEEWITGVIANELHRHLGVYATIGNKMGIRAREYFGAGVDELKITSFAGNIPPFSCMNDGLQVSTGATLGHGLIIIAADSVILPAANFSYMGRTIRISLKEEYRKRIESEIRNYRVVYGLSSDMYWEMVRNAAIRYWANWNRHEIFSIETDI